MSEKLVACANILGAATSIYNWKGVPEEAQEVVMILKTRRSLAPAASTRIKALHSYETPCIVVYDVSAGYPAYLDWIAAETRG